MTDISLATSVAASSAFNEALPDSPTSGSPYELLRREGWIKVTKTLDIDGVGGTGSDLFTVAGNVEAVIFGEFTDATDTGSLTAVSLELSDGEEQIPITAAVGTTLSNATVGSWVGRTALAASNLTFTNAEAAAVAEAGENSKSVLYPILLTAQNGGSTKIRLNWTGAAPTDCTILFTVFYNTLSASGGAISAA